MSSYCTEQVILTHKTLITSNYPTKTFGSFLHVYTDNSTMSYSKMSKTSSPKIGSFSRSSFKPFLRTCSAFLDKVYQSTDTSVEATKWRDMKDQGLSRGPSFNRLCTILFGTTDISYSNNEILQHLCSEFPVLKQKFTFQTTNPSKPTEVLYLKNSRQLYFKTSVIVNRWLLPHQIHL